MKRFLIVALLMLMSGFSLHAQTVQAPKGFAGQVWNSVFALYGTKGNATRFGCTAEVIAKDGEGYTLLSAGHCVQDIPAGVTFSVSEEIGGPRTPVKMLKAYLGEDEDTIDFALFHLTTKKSYPVLALGPDDAIQIGDATINVNFSMGMGKQLSAGVVASAPLQKSSECDENGCLGNFLVQEYAGPGASGSPVISAKTHRVIGILVAATNAPIGVMIEPISRLKEFQAKQNQPHPGLMTENALTIPQDVMKNTFGPDHTFMLTTHGPNPVFTQGGYTFMVDTDGFELSDEYYYDVPVFIDQNEDGEYRLVSTKDGYSVEIIVRSGPDDAAKTTTTSR